MDICNETKPIDLSIEEQAKSVLFLFIKFAIHICGVMLNLLCQANADPFRHYVVHAFGEKLHGVLVDCPCHAETHKTWDGNHFFKSGDVSQMLIAYRSQEGPPSELEQLFASDNTYTEYSHCD